MAAQISAAKYPAMLVDQAKIRQVVAGREKGPRGQFDRGPVVTPHPKSGAARNAEDAEERQT
jgi:hypothetical protein